MLSMEFGQKPLTSMCDKQSQQTGMKWYGASITVLVQASGDGKHKLCKFKRFKLDYVVDKLHDEDVCEEKFSPDGPAMQAPWTVFSQGDCVWNMRDLDAPTLCVVAQRLPAKKQAIYAFYVIDSDGSTNCLCATAYAIEIGISQQGMVTTKTTKLDSACEIHSLIDSGSKVRDCKAGPSVPGIYPPVR
jgi:hypothetical protein